MKPFRFLHAADLHLDSPFRGLTIEEGKLSERIRASTLDAFENLVKLAVDRQVDFVVIAGDVYDAADRSLRAQLRFRDGLARLAERGIRSFVAHGNHDPLDSRVSTIQWPEGVHVFGGPAVDTVPVERAGEVIAYVSGVSFPKKNEQRNLALKFARASEAPFHIGVLHCNVGGNTGHDPYAPCEINDLIERGLDYWALGHVHTRQTLNERPHVVYPGNTQGRHVRERGARGCVIVDVDSTGTVEVEFEPLDVMRWDEITVSIEGVGSLDGFDDRLFGALDAAIGAADGRPLLCRVSICGRGPIHRDLAREAAARELLERAREHYSRRSPFVWVEEISIDCRAEIDLEERSRAEDLLAQVLRVSGEIRLDEASIERLYSEALSRLFENSRAGKALEPLPHDERLRLLEEAEMLCVDRLENAV